MQVDPVLITFFHKRPRLPQIGIKVMVEGKNDVVVSHPRFLLGNRLNGLIAMRLFSVICGYRLVDVLAFLGGAYPLSTKVERTEGPTSPLPVCISGIYCWL